MPPELSFKERVLLSLARAMSGPPTPDASSMKGEHLSVGGGLPSYYMPRGEDPEEAIFKVDPLQHAFAGKRASWERNSLPSEPMSPEMAELAHNIMIAALSAKKK